jgi:hypothetical protein
MYMYIGIANRKKNILQGIAASIPRPQCTLIYEYLLTPWSGVPLEKLTSLRN